MGFTIIMWLAEAFLFTPTTLRRILSSVAQGPLNVPLISALRESLALNQSVRSLNLPQICLLVNLQCQIEFSWTATLLWRICDYLTQSRVQRSPSVFPTCREKPITARHEHGWAKLSSALCRIMGVSDRLAGLLLLVGSENAKIMPFIGDN